MSDASNETFHWDGRQISREQFEQLRSIGIVSAERRESGRERRNRIAEAIHVSCLFGDFSTDPEWAAQRAVMLADALIAELDK